MAGYLLDLVGSRGFGADAGPIWCVWPKLAAEAFHFTLTGPQSIRALDADRGKV